MGTIVEIERESAARERRKEKQCENLPALSHFFEVAGSTGERDREEKFEREVAGNRDERRASD